MKELRQIVRATRQLRRTRLPVNENLDLDLTQLATWLLVGVVLLAYQLATTGIA